MFKKGAFILLVVLTFSAATTYVYAHCQIPCGIYDDQMRIQMIREHNRTIEKSINMIKSLSNEKPVDYNQITRWVNAKEEHATKIQDIAFQYFMAQRIMPALEEDAAAYTKYEHELQLLHKMAVSAMKAKQSLDFTYTKEIDQLLEEFKTSYLDN